MRSAFTILRFELRDAGRLMLVLAVVSALTAILNPQFISPGNVENLVRRTSLFSILSLGIIFVMGTGGIDLSVGSIVALIGCLLPLWATSMAIPIWLASALLLMIGALIGLVQGLFVARLRIQPFLVTLCGLLIYRGAARIVTHDEAVGFGGQFRRLRQVAIGSLDLHGFLPLALPLPFFWLLLIAFAIWVLLHFTKFGRYVMAIGRNESAVFFSGVNTTNVKVSAYVISASMAALAGMLFCLDVNSAQASELGNLFELYSVAAVVLGGCSTRGGRANIMGAITGTALIQVLRNSIVLLGLPSQWEFCVIGAVLLLGVTADEWLDLWKSNSSITPRRNTKGNVDGT